MGGTNGGRKASRREHGTERGYQQHHALGRRLKEPDYDEWPACQACKDAHNIHVKSTYHGVPVATGLGWPKRLRGPRKEAA